MKAGLTIGELAKELHLNPKTIRYYEEVRLLPNPQRSESGYRLYSQDEAERLRLVRRLKLLSCQQEARLFLSLFNLRR